MIPCQRHLFNIPAEIAYFNCAYLSPQLNTVRDAGYGGVDRKSHPWQVGPEAFFAESELARELFARLIDAEAGDVAIIPAVSYGMAVAAANVAVSEKEEIVVLEDQFPSNFYPWSELANMRDARIVTVRPSPDLDWTAAVLNALNESTAIVTLPHVHWTDGSLLDLKKISARCQEIGAALLLDVTQSLGALPISVKEVHACFMVSAAYKWLLGPYSLAFMYVHPSYQAGRPIEQNWLNRKNSEDFARLVNYRDDFQPGARRFDVGERSNFALMPMAVAALRQILEWRIPNIQKTLAGMTDKLAERAQELGLEVAAPDARAGHILGLRFPEGLPPGILQRLAEENVYVSLRGDAMRIAPHLYNNEPDQVKLMDVLQRSL